VTGVESRFGATTPEPVTQFASFASERSTNPTASLPHIHIFTASKQSWIVLPPNILAVAEYYKASELWPKESLEREPYRWRGRNHSSLNASNHQRT
jgi:hypothetical protein